MWQLEGYQVLLSIGPTCRTARKIFAVILQRIKNSADIRTGRSCTNQIFAKRTIIAVIFL